MTQAFRRFGGLKGAFTCKAVFELLCECGIYWGEHRIYSVGFAVRIWRLEGKKRKFTRMHVMYERTFYYSNQRKISSQTCELQTNVHAQSLQSCQPQK